MRTSAVVATLVVLGLAAGGGYYGLEVYPQQQFRAGLDQALATLPPGTTATYQTAHYSIFSHTAVVTGMTVHGVIPSDPPQPFDVTAASIETDNPNPDFANSWARAVAAPTSISPDTALPVADSVTITGLKVHSAVVNVTEDSVRFAKLRVYPWALLHDGMPSWKQLQASLMPRPGPPAMDNLRAILRVEAAGVLGSGYDSYESGPAKVTQALPGIEIQYDVRKMSGDGFDRGITKGGSGEGIAFRSDKLGTISMDRVAIGPLDMREPMTKLINGEALSPALLDGIKIGRIEYGGITVRPPGKPMVHIGGFSFGPLAFTQGLPVAGELGWTDVSVSRSQVSDPRAQDAMDKLGLSTITTSFAFAYNYDASQQRATVHDTILKVNELGTMTVSVDLTNVIPTPVALSQIRLAHARLQFDDGSLVDRAMRAGAARSGVDPAAYRQQIVDLVRHQSDQPGNAGPQMEAACKAASDFIASPHSITVELAPPQPVSIAAFQGMNLPPGAIATMLGLVVSTKE